MVSALRDASLMGEIHSLRSYLRISPAVSPGRRFAARRLNALLRDHPLDVTARTWFGAKICADTKDMIQRYLYMFGIWEPVVSEWINRSLRPTDTFIDVGANVGYHTLFASHLVAGGRSGNRGRVVAIEPLAPAHRSLCRNLEVNGNDNVRSVQAAVAETGGRMKLHLRHSYNWGGASVVRPRDKLEKSYDVPALPWDAAVTDEEMGSARIIKIDVEGSEGTVMDGVAKRLTEARADLEILIEISPARLAAVGRTERDVLGPFLSAGFRAYELDNDYDVARYAAKDHRHAPERLPMPVTKQCDVVLSRR